MAIENPSRNPFLGIYQRPQGGQASNVGMGQPEDFLSSEEVIGRPDAQNTAQRSKASSAGLKDAYDAVAKGSDLLSPEQQGAKELADYAQAQKRWSNVKGNPFTGEKRDAFEAILNKRELSPKQLSIYQANKSDFDAIISNIESAKSPFGDLMSAGPRMLMPMGGSKTKSQLGQSSSTANVASQYEVRYDKSGNPFRKERTSPTMLPANVSQYETIGTRLSSMAARQGQPIAAPTPRLDAMKAMNPQAQKTARRPLTQEEEARLGSIFPKL